MSQPDQSVICPRDIAVNVTHVTKHYEQWQRENNAKNLLKNLIHPEKRRITALDDVSFTIVPGEFAAYAGPNGAGKSTTMKLLAGMLYPTSGDISVLGLSPIRDRVALMKRLGVMFGNRSELWWDHPIIQSFEWKKVVWDIPDERYRRMRDLVIELLDLGDLMHTFARELSLGQRMRADLGLLLLHEPELILLDEPTLGLDVLAKRQMIRFLRELNQEKNTTILVTSHDMDDLEEMARRILMISSGRVAFDGTFDELRKTAGSVCRISVTFSSGAGDNGESPDGHPLLTGTRFVRCSEGMCEYEFDREVTPIRDVLGEISRLSDVDDVEIKKAPIEEVISNLYIRWKGKTE